MAFCSKCGSEVEGQAKFCAKCGAPVAAAAGAQAASSAPPYQAPPQASAQAPFPTAQAPGLEENMACALCYILGLISGVLFLVLAPYNQNRLIRFHAFQSIFLNVAWIAVLIAASIVSVVLLPIPIIGAIIGLILHFGLALVGLVLWVMLMYKAYNKERWVLPIIGPLAEKQA